MLQIADDASSDWSYNPRTGRLSVNKEAMLRSKVRIETRQWQTSRRHPFEWGDRQQIDLKSDIASLTPEERMLKAEEMLEMIAYIKAGGPPKPPPLHYDPTEGDDELEPEGGIGGRSAR